MSHDKGVPKPLRDLLRHRWNPYNVKADYWEIHKRNARRWHDPASYGVTPSKGDDAGVVVFEEAVAIARLSHFDGLVRVQSSTRVQANEHALHAISAFCSQAFGAWLQLESRLAETPKER